MKNIAYWLNNKIKGRDKILITIFILGIIIRVFYLSYTPYDTRTHDVVGGHIDYIKYLIQNKSLPLSTDCWECFQPPTYYIISSTVYWLAQSAGTDNPYFYLQLLSLLFFLIFIFFGIKTISALNTERNITRITVLLITFWPSSIIHSVRIGNDTLLYALYAAGFYYLIKWAQKENEKWFYLSLLFSVLSMLVKSNGFMLVLVVAITFIYKWLVSLKQNDNYFSYLKNGLIFFVVFTIGFSLALYMPIINYKNNDSKSKDFVIGNIHALNGALLVSNRLANYLKFDIKTFINEPFMNPWSDETGRQYYWNYLLKSSLFGEFDFGKNKNIVVTAKLISSFFIIIAGYFFVILSLALSRKKTTIRNIPGVLFAVFASIIIPLLILIVTRIKHPYSSQADFRYIFPVMAPVAFLCALGLENLKNKLKMLKYFGYVLSIVFAILTILFFVFSYIYG